MRRLPEVIAVALLASMAVCGLGVGAFWAKWQEPWEPKAPVESPSEPAADGGPGGTEGAPPGGWEPAPCSHRRPVGECALDGGAE